jgi:glycogen debranching enzyme
MPAEANAVCLRFTRVPGNHGKPVGAEAQVRLTVRLDLEDRSHHGETEANEGLNEHFRNQIRPLAGQSGFAFEPAPGRVLRASISAGNYHPEPEWCRAVPHPHEATRGQRERGDAWSPGWFELVLAEGESVLLTLNAEADETSTMPPPFPRASPSLEEVLRAAVPAFLANRDGETTVLAGYPWFLDWGRDSLIACRGLLDSDFQEEALSVLRAFGALERDGTLPNVLNGADNANRESSDAPLWFALACEEAVRHLGEGALDAACGARTLRGVLASIARGYLRGTPTGVRVDAGSGLVWSPAHFTWMDTNHPAGSPREGYPIELQALWLRLLRFLDRLGTPTEGESWSGLASRAEASLERYWREELGFAADALHAGPGQSALHAVPDDHLRPNQLWLVTLGIWQGARAQRLVQACGRHLLVPGALRSLAPLAVERPLPVCGAGGQALNDPFRPYFGHYEGDEDSRRKPAYHNGTGWVWLLPLYAEALAAAWPGDARARAAAKAILGSVSPLLETGCSGQLPELVDGDAPHRPRGCDAQAWSVTEALRVWLKLNQSG